MTNFENPVSRQPFEMRQLGGRSIPVINRVDEFVSLNLGWEPMLWGIAVYVVSAIVGLVIGGLVLIKLPPNYFQDPVRRGLWRDRHPALRWAAAAPRNALGAVLLVIGLILALPGVPGPGTLTMFFAVLLLDFPGKVPMASFD